MYKKAKRFDDMLRLVGQYHKELLAGTHVHLAKQLEADPATITQAETHYVAGGEWQVRVRGLESVCGVC
jgi:intraflagellar transport protein 172